MIPLWIICLRAGFDDTCGSLAAQNILQIIHLLYKTLGFVLLELHIMVSLEAKLSSYPVKNLSSLPHPLFLLPFIPSSGCAALPLKILSMLHLVHEPSHKITSDILLLYSLRVIISKPNIPRESLFPPWQSPSAAPALTWHSGAFMVGGLGGWDRTGTDLCQSSVCA